MNRTSIPAIVKQLRRAASLLEESGDQAWKATADWHTHLTAGGGPGQINSVSDPTGTAVLGYDPVANLHPRYLAALTMIAGGAAEVISIVGDVVAVKHAQERHSKAESCASCDRAGKFSAVHRRDLCQWCYRFEQDHAQHPPLSLVEAHHRGERISERDVERALRRTA